MKTTEIKKILTRKIKLEIDTLSSTKDVKIADCHFYGVCYLIRFAKDVDFFTKEQEKYFSSKALTAYMKVLNKQFEREHENV